MSSRIFIAIAAGLVLVAGAGTYFVPQFLPLTYLSGDASVTDALAASSRAVVPQPKPALDKAAYDAKLLFLAHISTSTVAQLVAATPGTTSLSSYRATSLASTSIKQW